MGRPEVVAAERGITLAARGIRRFLETFASPLNELLARVWRRSPWTLDPAPPGALKCVPWQVSKI
jgi:hypothetical protein